MGSKLNTKKILTIHNSIQAKFTTLSFQLCLLLFKRKNYVTENHKDFFFFLKSTDTQATNTKKEGCENIFSICKVELY